MQEKESVMVVRFKLKIQSLWITVWHHSASRDANSYPRDGIFNPNRLTIRDSYIIIRKRFAHFRDKEKRLKSDPDYDPRTLYIPDQEKTKFTPVSTVKT